MKKLLIACALAVVAFGANADPPDQSGIVMRGDYMWGIAPVDEEAGLMAVLGFDPVEVCSGNFDFDVISWSDKDIQDGLRLSTLAKGDMTTSVWNFYPFQGNCNRFLTEQPLATGLSKYKITDNDWYGLRYCDSKNNMNTVTRSAHGALYTPSGERKQFQWVRNNWFDCDTETVKVHITRIRLH